VRRRPDSTRGKPACPRGRPEERLRKADAVLFGLVLAAVQVAWIGLLLLVIFRLLGR
jgi:hypothetical protein